MGIEKYLAHVVCKSPIPKCYLFGSTISHFPDNPYFTICPLTPMLQFRSFINFENTKKKKKKKSEKYPCEGYSDRSSGFILGNMEVIFLPYGQMLTKKI